MYSYLGDGQLSTEARPDGTVARTYDPFGRVQAVVDGPYGVTYTYVEPTSRVYQAIATGGGITVETDYLYDGSLPTKLTWSQGVPGAPYVDIGYDGLGRIAQRDVNGLSSTALTYGADGLPSQIGGLTITRDPIQTPSGGGEGPSGLIASTRLGAAVSDTWGYDWFGEFSDYTATFGTNTYTLNLVRDSLGRVITKTENGAATSYTYDTLGRLSDVCTGTDATCVTGTILRSYVYGPNGNRMSTPSGGGSASVDHQDRLETYGAASYTFTDGGDLATKTDGTGTTSYSYDRRRNLRSVALPNNIAINYVVDAMNRRVGRTVSQNGTTVAAQYWVYQDGLRPIAELNAAGVVTSVFIYGTKNNVPDYMIQGSKSYRFITDQLGSVRYVVDASNGTIAQQTVYDEYGNATVVSDQLSPSAPGYVAFQPFGFAGGLWDEATGLVKFGARDYDATTGRWTSKDKRLLSAGLNVYAYADNDPLDKIDPMGTDPTGNAN